MKNWIKFQCIQLFGLITFWIPLKWVVLVSRSFSVLLAPFSNIAGQYRRVLRCRLSLKENFVLGYKRSVSKLEMQIWRHRKEPSISEWVQFEGLKNLENSLTQKRGVILVSVHHYCVRISSLWLNQFSSDFRPYLLKNFFSKDGCRVYQFLHQQQQILFENRLIHSVGDMRSCVRLLREGGSLIILQDVFKGKSEFVEFLGRRLPNPMGAARLAEMTDSLLIPFIATADFSFFKTKENQGKHWKLHFWEPIDPRHQNTKERLLSGLEEMIKTYPEAWERWSLIPF